MMFLTKKFNIGLTLMLFCILLSACGPSPEEQPAEGMVIMTSAAVLTAAAQTADAATHTPIPTETPVPLPTLTPSPTPPFSGVLEVYEVYNVVIGWGWPANASLSVALNSEAGELKEEQEIVSSNSGEIPWTEFHVDMEPKDTFLVKLGADQVQFSLRLPEVTIHTESNTILGSVQPFQEVNTVVERRDVFYENVQTIADSMGEFSVSYPEYVDLKLGDRIWIGQVVHSNAIMVVTEFSKQIQYEPAPSTAFFVEESNRIKSILDIPGFAAAGDLDNDGDEDLVLSSFAKYPVIQSPGIIYILDNDGTGYFSDVTIERFLGEEIYAYARGIAIEDLTGDGWLDVVIATEDLHAPPYTKYRDIILVNQGEGYFVDETQARFPDYPVYSHGLCMGDVENDGDIDIFFPFQYEPTGLMINDGEGNFSIGYGHLPPIKYDEISCEFGDFDQDGDLDLFLGTERISDRNRILINDGMGKFHLAPATALPKKPSVFFDLALAIKVADFNSDGYPDVVTANANYWDQETGTYIHPSQARFNQLLINNGDGTFRDMTQNLPQSFDGGATWDIAVIDIDGDGDLDIIPANEGAPAGIVYLNDGQGVFEEMLNSILPSSLEDDQSQILTFDFDGDLDEDVLFIAHFRHSFYRNLYSP